MGVFHHRGKRTAIVFITLAFAVTAFAIPSVQAAKPTRTPLPLGSTEFEAGMACPFPVTITPLPGSRLTETVFSDGTVLITSQGRDQVTNAVTGESIVVSSSGTLRFEEEADGSLLVTTAGHITFFFFPGDEGPFGTVGEDGALYHVIGRATETLDPEQVVTSFSWSGQATDLCALIS